MDEKLEEKGINRKRLKISLFISATILIAFCVFIGKWIYFHKNFVWTNDAFVETYETVVSSRFGGVLEKIFVHEGDAVAENQPLALIKSFDIDKEIEILEKKIEGATLEINSLETYLQSQGANALSSEKKIEYDIGLEALKTQKSISESELSFLKKNKEDCLIKASSVGVIGKRLKWVGDLISPQDPLFALFNEKELWISARVIEKKLSKIAPGAKVKITFDSLAEKVFMGEVSFIGKTTLSKVAPIQGLITTNFTKIQQRVPVRILLTSPPSESDKRLILPGVSCEVIIEISK